ncbi:DoxX family protein [Oceaniglobus ichthyenteri]|uniref:DoxX family protein n=1 Tax=Oceaniglobus ichthyenteri TaxID=2136177 RepID=UPI0023E84705|nr:DoxX family membrane protein [Oceaniglobus ichthyenteri]
MITKESAIEKTLHRAGRVLLALLFFAGAMQKMANPDPAMGLLIARGLPGWLIWPALVFNGVAGVALIAGWALRPLGLALAAYCIFTSWFHFIPSDPWQMSILVKNWAIAGGCLILAAGASGRNR